MRQLVINDNGIEELRSGIGDKTYVHTQYSANTVWNISHGLNKKPSVISVDSLHREQKGDVQYIDGNNLTITFKFAISGEAYCN